MDKFEKRFVDYTCGLKWEALSSGAINAVKERLIDSLACVYAAYDYPAAKAARQLAKTVSSPTGAIVIGTNYRSTVFDAAFANGTMIRALDWSDTYLNREPAHPSDNIGATLAVANAENKSGKDFILATVLAYEFQCQLCDAAGIRKKGWDHVTYGSISSTAAAAKLLGLSAEETRHAIGIAVTTGNYLRQTRIGTISLWKAGAFAKAAKNAVEAAYCVKCGFTGPYDIIEGQHGLINQITRGEFDLAENFGGEGGNKRFKIEDTYIKFFPAEYHSQSAIWAALDLRKKVDIEELDSILIETSHHSYQIIGMEREKWTPKTKETADHSLPYMTAVTLMDGELTLKQFDQAHLADQKLLALIQKITVKEKKEYTDLYGTSFPNKITIKTKAGKIFEQEVLDPKGHPKNPLSKTELEAKFKAAANGLVSEENQKRLLDTIWGLEKVANIGDLFPLMVVK